MKSRTAVVGSVIALVTVASGCGALGERESTASAVDVSSQSMLGSGDGSPRRPAGALAGDAAVFWGGEVGAPQASSASDSGWIVKDALGAAIDVDPMAKGPLSARSSLTAVTIGQEALFWGESEVITRCARMVPCLIRDRTGGS